MKILRRGLITLLISGLLSWTTPLSAGIQQPRRKFEQKLEKATLALYVENGSVTHFTCTATAYEKIEGGYLLLSAGHCIDGRDTLNFYVKTDVDDNLPLMPVKVVKYELDENRDFSILEFDTKLSIPTIQIGSEDELAIGDKVENVSFALGIAKQYNNGYVATDIMKPNDVTTQSPTYLLNHYLVEIDGGHGSSGSAIVSKKSHHIVGVLVSGLDGELIGFGVMPMSKFYAFRADPKITAHHPPPPPDTSIGFGARNALCCSKEVAGHIKLALQYVANGQDEQEACFVVDQMLGPGPIRLGDKPDTCQIEVTPTTLAVFHTHPNHDSPWPSRHDIDIAKQYDILMYVIQPNSLAEYNPATGKTIFVSCHAD